MPSEFTNSSMRNFNNNNMEEHAALLKKLREELNEKDEEIRRLKQQLEKRECKTFPGITTDQEAHHIKNSDSSADNKLSNECIARFSRQLILPQIGVKGQQSISKCRVLVVGAGGLGCPVSIYLVAAGIGKLGVVDYDAVELNNLHRQILHTESRLGIPKSLSLVTTCAQLNSAVEYVPHHLQLNSKNAVEIIENYDIVVDASDNVATRYLVNDACVMCNKPLVSGSALRFEGQLTVYNYGGGPCYRCLFPKPPPPETVTNCSDGGVLGVVPGIIGCLQALEVIKIAAGIGSSFNQQFLMFDGLDGSFRKIKLRPRQNNCVACGEGAEPTLIDYEQFCGTRADDKERHLNILSNKQRLTVEEYKRMLDQDIPHVLVDVRQPVEVDICSLPSPAINIPISEVKCPARLKAKLGECLDSSETGVVVVCHHGNDSQIAVKEILKTFQDNVAYVKDIQGGLQAWAKRIDTKFPKY